MPRTVPCPSCGRQVRLDSGGARCPACDVVIASPAEDGDQYSDRPLARPLPPPLPSSSGGSAPTPSRFVRRPPRTELKVVLALAGVALVTVIAGFVYLVARGVFSSSTPAPAGPPTAVFPDAEELRRRGRREALAREGPLPDVELTKLLGPLFDQLGAAYNAGDADRVLACFDHPRLRRELFETYGPAVSVAEPGFTDGMRASLRQSTRKPEDVGWLQTEVRRVRSLSAADAVVFVRHRQASGTVLIMRWWVTRESGEWKVYDLEGLDLGLRYSAHMGVTMPGGAAGAEASQAIAALTEASHAVWGGEAAVARAKLALVPDHELPTPVEALRALVQAGLFVQEGRPQDALEELDRADRLRPNMPLSGLHRAAAHNRLGQWDKGLKYADAYRDLLGDAWFVSYQRGQALLGLRRYNEAAAAHRLALDEAPGYGDAFLGLLRSLGGTDNLDDLRGRFAKHSHHRQTFLICAEDCAGRSAPALLEALVEGMRRIDPKLAAVDYYLGLARALQGKSDEAVRLFQAAVKAEPDAETRKTYRNGFLKAMADAGAAAAAYGALPDREAFAHLARITKERGDSAELKKLVRAHSARHPGDPLAPFYRGAALVHEGRFTLADRTFATGMKAPPDNVALASFHVSRVLARCRAAGPLAAYREIGPRDETFEQLAAQLLGDGELAALEALLGEHAKHQPDAAALARYRFRLKARQGKAGEATRLLRAALAGQKDDARRKGLISDFLRDMAQAGKAVDAYRAAPDARTAFEELASDYSGSRAELPLLIEAHPARDGDDPLLALHDGQRLLDEKAAERAAAVLIKGWKKAPEALKARYRYSAVRALYKAGALARAYEEVGPRDQTFAQLAWALRADKKGDELERLVAAQRHCAPATPDLLEHATHASLLRQQPGRALALFRRALAELPEAQRATRGGAFAVALAEAGLHREAYEAFPDKPAAFQALARSLYSRPNTDALAHLLEAHRERHPGDPYRLFYQGELYLRRGDVLQAERHFALALTRAPRGADWQFRDALRRARVRAGKALTEYRAAGRTEAVFAELARACEVAKDGRQLDDLIAAHRAAHGEDADVLPWQVESRWLRKDAGGAVRLLIAHRAELAHSAAFRWKFDDRLVRGLVRMGRRAEALREAEAADKKGRLDSLLLVLAHAANGDAKRATEAVARQRWQRWLIGRCYTDEDLGPLLRGEAMRAFRAKYPEPKGSTWSADDWD